MKRVTVVRKGSYQGVPQWGISTSNETTPSKATAEKWAALKNHARDVKSMVMALHNDKASNDRS